MGICHPFRQNEMFFSAFEQRFTLSYCPHLVIGTVGRVMAFKSHDDMFAFVICDHQCILEAL